MPNVHTPERLPGESFPDYKERRVESKLRNKQMQFMPRTSLKSSGGLAERHPQFLGRMSPMIKAPTYYTSVKFR
jgi:hypothetical protein